MREISEFEILVYAKKFFPHLGEKYGRLCVIAVLESMGLRNSAS